MHAGSTHLVEEYFSGMPAEKLSIQFRSSLEFFDKTKYQSGLQTGDITASVYGHVGFSHEPDRDEDGKVIGGRLPHMGRDTSWGCVLLSHFISGRVFLTPLPEGGVSPRSNSLN
jgi:hypothetical protein